MEITLIRHGEPEYELKGRARSKEVSNVVRDYDLSGIKDRPSAETIATVSGSEVVVCSDLKRSLDSASALGFQHVHHSKPLFREIAIPHFDNGEFSMSIDHWSIFLRVISIFGFSRNGESLLMARRRAKEAASALVKLAEKEKRVLLVGHGFINYFIAKELLKRDWRGPSTPGGGYWDYGTYKFIST